MTGMNNKKESEEQFHIILEDAQLWLAKARQLKMSASLMWPEFEIAAQSSQVHDGMTERMLAFSEAYMLLMGFSFENLLKGIILGRDPSDKTVKIKGGHGVVQMADTVTVLTSDERDLLARIQIYLHWAGRYQLPKNPEQYHEAQGRVSITTADPGMANQLFGRLEQLLLKEWKQRNEKFSV